MALVAVGGLTAVFMLLLGFLALLSVVSGRSQTPYILVALAAYGTAVAVLSGVV